MSDRDPAGFSAQNARVGVLETDLAQIIHDLRVCGGLVHAVGGIHKLLCLELRRCLVPANCDLKNYFERNLLVNC